ncbi:EB1 family Mal3 [Schizosaccharomyces japonicus yFS275]|uniref:EB1 family Mal3 n=1 Tax=Schizosaccharomyces japonicus (strain yFS275 / FY16936) TaxID=402676 RepID=B6JZK5_SCHJY|nr:EB1 family Mal3 [Schizosaccharomyces japonicus yFS275]EEB06973.1 EB1 family Mal3 [Schizosaccharomyces japonicus yFS275]
MTESRQELLAWINDVTKLNLRRIEDCGKGYAMIQIFDSIFRDAPLKKVNFNCYSEYQYINNWKVLQQVFLRKGIEKLVDAERLSRCKMQDNLEFVQWAKKFWDQYYPGGTYDAIARRGGREPPAISGNPVSAVGHTAAATSTRRRVVSSGSGSSTPTMASASVVAHHAPSVPSAASLRAKQAQQQIANLESQLLEANETMLGLERERDFYFNKLREIEILMQTTSQSPDTAKIDVFLEQVQRILYSTEEGFEQPTEGAMDPIPADSAIEVDMQPVADANVSSIAAGLGDSMPGENQSFHMKQPPKSVGVDPSSTVPQPDFVRARLKSLELDEDDENLTF